MKKFSSDGATGTTNTDVLLGAHFSIAKGLHKAVFTAQDYGCTALQIFTKNANSWREKTVTADQVVRFQTAVAETGIRAIAAHTSYLINLAAPDATKHAKSCEALKQELIRSSQLGLPFVVLHPGAHMDDSPEAGLQRIVDSINHIFSQVNGLTTRLLLETTAGQGSSIGHRFEQIAEMLAGIENREHIGVCLDTSHIYAAGYDLGDRASCDETLATFDRVIGLDRLFFIHLNDSKKALGSRVDRHEHIGRGEIGDEAFKFFMTAPQLRAVPKVIETPKGDKQSPDYDRQNLDRLRAFASA